MIKKELQQMPKLKATPYMMRLATEDKPTIEKSWGHTHFHYKRLGYTRCCVKNGILKLAIFFTEPMRMGGKLPTYEIYFDREKKQYLTYDCRNEKWLTASFYHLNMPSYSYYANEKSYCLVGKQTKLYGGILIRVKTVLTLSVSFKTTF